jgi:hypothetical protein
MTKISVFFQKIVAVVTITVAISCAQNGMVQPRRLVDAPTAGVLPKASFDFESRIFPSIKHDLGAGLTMGIAVGITDRLNIGLSYGGEGLVGRGRKAEFYSVPGWLVKYRIIEENYALPGIAIGYDHQGYGGIADTSKFDYKGYLNKSPGFFLAASKNYMLFSKVQLGFHAAINYSMEERKNVRWPNLFAGIDFGINEELSLVFEYDFGFNVKDVVPNKHPVYARMDEGYLNGGIRWAFSPNFYIEFDGKDLLENRKYKNGSTVGWGRELKFVYYTKF